jgi:hypothetical protein
LLDVWGARSQVMTGQQHSVAPMADAPQDGIFRTGYRTSDIHAQESKVLPGPNLCYPRLTK